MCTGEDYIKKKSNSTVSFYRQDSHVSRFLCQCRAVDYKSKSYGVMKWCFILLTHFVLVKNFEAQVIF